MISGHLLSASSYFCNVQSSVEDGRHCSLLIDLCICAPHAPHPPSRVLTSDYQGVLQNVFSHPGGTSGRSGQIMDPGALTRAHFHPLILTRGGSIPRLVPPETWEAVQFITTAGATHSACVQLPDT